MDVTAARACGAHHHLVGRYPGWQNNLHRLPRCRCRTPSGWLMEAEHRW